MTPNAIRWVMGMAVAAMLAAAVACGGGVVLAHVADGFGRRFKRRRHRVRHGDHHHQLGGVVSPSTVTIRQGGRVTFVNNDSRAHDMASDPHPTHEDCPAIDQAGFLSPGQSRTTGNLNVVRSCGFHDHNLPSSTGLQGRITIVAQ